MPAERNHTDSQRRSSEIRVGITVLVAIATLIWGMAWLKEYTVERNTRLWKVRFREAGGLAASDEVLVNGIRKGMVKHMRLDGDHVMVDLLLSNEINLTTDSRVSIRNVGLMGEKVIAVDLRTTGRPYAENEIVPGNYELGLGEIMGQLGTTVDAVVSVSDQLRQVSEVLGKEGRLAATIQNFNSTSEELRLAVSENRAMLRETMGNMAAASRTARQMTTDREAQIGKTLDDFSSAAQNLDRLAVRLDSLRAVIQSVTARVDSGEGTLGKLVHDEKLYTDLNASVQSLKFLLEDIKAHPKKYFKFSVF